MTTPTTCVEVKGLGCMPEQFDVDFQGANIDQNGGSMHDESKVSIACNYDDRFFDDDFNISGYWNKELRQYTLEIRHNSEAGILYWNDGQTLFTFDEASQHWSMKGYKFYGGALEWYFCKPEAVVDRLLAGLGCYTRDVSDAGQTTPVDQIASSISADRENIVKTANRYAKEDCDAPTSQSFSDAMGNGEVIW